MCVNILLLCVQGLRGPRKHTLCEFFCVAIVLHLPGVGRCSVEFFCVIILLLCVQGLCGPRKHTLCEFLCVAVDCLSCTASAVYR